MGVQVARARHLRHRERVFLPALQPGFRGTLALARRAANRGMVGRARHVERELPGPPHQKKKSALGARVVREALAVGQSRAKKCVQGWSFCMERLQIWECAALEGRDVRTNQRSMPVFGAE